MCMIIVMYFYPIFGLDKESSKESIKYIKYVVGVD